MPDYDNLIEFMQAKFEDMEDITLEDIFEELILALNPFYYVEVQDTGSLIPDFSCVPRKDIYPKLRLVGEIYSSALYIEAELKFDAILQTDNSQYGEISDIVYKWADIADIVSKLEDYAIDLTI